MVHQLAVFPLLLTLQVTILGHTALCDDTAEVDAPSLGQDTVISKGYTAFPDVGVAYKYFDLGLSWDDARDHCIAEGGNLAIIDSIEKLKHAKSLAPPNDTKHLLVGIHKNYSDSEWFSVKTDSSMPYIPWRTGEQTISIARCVGLVTNEDGLQTFDCDGWSHLCEISIDQTLHKIQGNRTRDEESGATLVLNGYIKVPDAGMAYKYYAQNFTWDSARRHCIADGGNLAVIDSLEKIEQVISKIPENGPPPFVGIHRLFDHSEWVNLKTGLPAIFVPWKGDADLSDANQSCVRLWTSGVSPVSCSIRGSYMCEVPMSKSLQKSLSKAGHRSSSRSAAELPSGYTVFPELGVAYKYYSTGITWNGARKYCATHGSKLAVIDSYEKVERVIHLKTSNRNVHVGFHRLFDEWVDVEDGSPATAIPWRATSYETDKSRKCMSLSTCDVKNGLIANDCNATEAFVCELSIFKD